jgi:hypothetical protein
MDCPSCGRPLANNAKCVYCAHGNTFQRKEQLTIPEGTVGGHRKEPFPVGRLLFFLILAAAVAACFLHPGLNAAIRSLINQ